MTRRDEEFVAMRARVQAVRSRRRQALQLDARTKATKIAQMLGRNYRVGRVILYGSVAEDRVRERSDIDLYVEGLADDYWRAFLDAEAIASPLTVSIVTPSQATDTLKRSISERGIPLWP